MKIFIQDNLGETPQFGFIKVEEKKVEKHKKKKEKVIDQDDEDMFYDNEESSDEEVVTRPKYQPQIHDDSGGNFSNQMFGSYFIFG